MSDLSDKVIGFLQHYGAVVSCTTITMPVWDDSGVNATADVTHCLLIGFSNHDAASRALADHEVEKDGLYTLAMQPSSERTLGENKLNELSGGFELGSRNTFIRNIPTAETYGLEGRSTIENPLLSPRHAPIFRDANSPRFVSLPTHQPLNGGVPETAQHRYDFCRAEAQAGGPRARTTLMLRNIPCRWAADELLAAVEAHVGMHWTLLYLPCKSLEAANAGFAFLDLPTSADALRVYDGLHCRPWPWTASRKVCEVRYARLQGPQLAQHLLEAASDPSRAARGYLAIRNATGQVTVRQPARRSLQHPIAPASATGCSQRSSGSAESVPTPRQLMPPNGGSPRQYEDAMYGAAMVQSHLSSGYRAPLMPRAPRESAWPTGDAHVRRLATGRRFSGGQPLGTGSYLSSSLSTGTPFIPASHAPAPPTWDPFGPWGSSGDMSMASQASSTRSLQPVVGSLESQERIGNCAERASGVWPHSSAAVQRSWDAGTSQLSTSEWNLCPGSSLPPAGNLSWP